LGEQDFFDLLKLTLLENRKRVFSPNHFQKTFFEQGVEGNVLGRGAARPCATRLDNTVRKSFLKRFGEQTHFSVLQKMSILKIKELFNSPNLPFRVF